MVQIASHLSNTIMYMISNGRVAYLVNSIAVRSEQGFWYNKCLYTEGVIIRNLKRPSFKYLQKIMMPLQWHEKRFQDPVIKFTGFPNLTSRPIWYSGVGKVRGRPCFINSTFACRQLHALYRVYYIRIIYRDGWI